MSWWNHYPKGSVGNVLHFLYYICNFDVAEHATIGNSQINYWGKTIATFSFDEDNFPIIKFKQILNDRALQQRIADWETKMESRRLLAIEDYNLYRKTHG